MKIKETLFRKTIRRLLNVRHYHNYASRLFYDISRNTHTANVIDHILDVLLKQDIRERQQNHPNPLCRYGRFGFAQADEDGITLEIIRRLGITTGVFCEFGVGDGTENNTLVLLAKGWRGAWIGNDDLEIDVPENGRLKYVQTWVTKDNVVGTYKNLFKNEEIGLISIDFDGNDFYFIQALLENGIKAEIFIVEYNAQMPVSVEFKIAYDENHKWNMDDYYGASLLTYVNLFKKYDYSLICCNAATAANAFFIKNKYMDRFPEVPDDISQIYVEGACNFPRRSKRISVKTVQEIIK